MIIKSGAEVYLISSNAIPVKPKKFAEDVSTVAEKDSTTELLSSASKSHEELFETIAKAAEVWSATKLSEN